MTQTAVNYGKVLIQLQIDRAVILEAKEQFEAAPKLAEVLSSPVIAQARKNAVIDKVFAQPIRNFLKTVCRNQRMGQIKEIFEAYEEQYIAAQNILKAEVEYVKAPNETELQGIKTMLCKKYGAADATISLRENPALIGGFIIYANGEVLDRSVKGRLEMLKRELVRR